MPLPEDFLAGCRQVLPPAVDPARLPTRRVGRTAELCERLTGYILARQKTGVFSQPEDFPESRLPSAGDYVILVNFSDEPRCLIRYDECRLMPFLDVGPEETAVETAALRDVEAWRRLHRNYWRPVFEARGEEFNDELDMVFQRFTVLYPPPPAATGLAPAPPAPQGRPAPQGQ